MKPLILFGLTSAGDWDHLANAPQYAPNTWGIMTTAAHSCPGLSDVQLFGDSFIMGVDISPAKSAQVADTKGAVRTLIIAYADSLNKVQGENRAFKINFYEGGAVSRYWDVTPSKARATVNDCAAMDALVEGGRQGDVMGMMDW